MAKRKSAKAASAKVGDMVYVVLPTGQSAGQVRPGIVIKAREQSRPNPDGGDSKDVDTVATIKVFIDPRTDAGAAYDNNGKPSTEMWIDATGGDEPGQLGKFYTDAEGSEGDEPGDKEKLPPEAYPGQGNRDAMLNPNSNITGGT